MPAKGRKLLLSQAAFGSLATAERAPMNKPFSESDFATPEVTTGPIAGSRKGYTAPEAAPDLRVPRRAIAHTEGDAAIEVEKGLKRARAEWVRERGGVEEYEGRAIKAVDNGNASGKHLA